MKIFRMTILLFTLGAATASATPPDRAELKNCTYYRSKRADVPVYTEPATTAERIGSLAGGDQVCAIGEKGDFIIMRWDLQALIRGDAETAGPEQIIGYVRTVQLWEPARKNKDFGEQMQEYLKLRQSGTTPSDPLWPIRPLIGIFGSGDPCKDPSMIGCGASATPTPTLTP